LALKSLMTSSTYHLQLISASNWLQGTSTWAKSRIIGEFAGY